MMTNIEKKAIAFISLVFMCRMLGMFLVLPVLVIYSPYFSESTPLLIGVAIGIYGMMQAIFQIPFGLISDYIGRHTIIILGLLMFIIGGLITSYTTSIFGLIIGRAVQGAGAISSTLMALLSDLTSEKYRNKAMAIIGITIAISFPISIILGPKLTQLFGIHGLFKCIVLIALFSIIIVLFFVPKTTNTTQFDWTKIKNNFFFTIKNSKLLKLNISIFILHTILISNFFAFPLKLVIDGNISKDQHWFVYLIVLMIGVLIMFPFINYAAKKEHITQHIIIGAIGILLFSELFFLISNNGILIIICMILFFSAFNLLESLLPSLVSKMSLMCNKGTALGIYSSSKFLGAALGGFVGGLCFELGGLNLIFIICSILALIWGSIIIKIDFCIM